MQFLLKPNHVHLINACYPPSSSILSAGPEYSPNSQELSRLTYYASNHPGKISKLGSELEKKVKTDAKKARSGHSKHRASLLITLSTFKSLAVECRRDLAMLSPALVSSLQTAATTLSTDLEVVVRVANVLTAWTTYTDGHLIGTDSALTRDYLDTLRVFAELSRTETKNNDEDTHNRTRLIGFAALTSALNSDALLNDLVQYKEQVSIIIPSILNTLLQADPALLEDRATHVAAASTSPYLAEFRTRPAFERRAASIHIHVDGDKGPTLAEVTSSCLAALYTMVERANGSQLDYVMKASLDYLDQVNGWTNSDVCCWYARKACEWSMYQYRYAIPTILVERLLHTQDNPETKPIHTTLTAMIMSAFNSPNPFINLSTSDIVANLITVLLRRTKIDPKVELLSAIVRCIASLGKHVYYADQISELSAELSSRLVMVAQGTLGPDSNTDSRTQGIRCLLAALVELMEAADSSKSHKSFGQSPPGSPAALGHSRNTMSVEIDISKKNGRTRIPPDIWQDILNLLCDEDHTIRSHFAMALKVYLAKEATNVLHIPHSRSSLDDRRSVTSVQSKGHKDKHVRDPAINKLLNTIHGYFYTLATSATTQPPPALPASSPNEDIPDATAIDGGVPEVRILPATPALESLEPSTRLPSDSKNPPSLQRLPSRLSAKGMATLYDYAHIIKVLCTAHEHLPANCLLAGVPMLMALDIAIDSTTEESDGASTRILAIRQVIAHVWLTIGKVWGVDEIVSLAEMAVISIPESQRLPAVPDKQLGVHALEEPPYTIDVSTVTWQGLDSKAALRALVSSRRVQEGTGFDEHTLLRQLTTKWSADSTLKDISEITVPELSRGEGGSPLLKISPALMHIENLSLASLARSSKGVGVSELRQALEGNRNSMSNTTLSRAASISTLESPSHAGINQENKLTLTTSRVSKHRAKKRTVVTGAGEVRDVLNRLGIGKPSQGRGSSLLKASFSKPDLKENQDSPSP